jgi:hydrogenase nickel incorporation protein HypA/HybF
MHELSVATGLVDRAVDAAADAGAERVDRLTVAVGKATHLNPDQLRFAVEMAASETMAAGARVEVERPDPRATCDCGWDGEPDRLDEFDGYVAAPTCPECGDRVRLVAGEECRLVSVEVPEASDGDRTQEAT